MMNFLREVFSDFFGKNSTRFDNVMGTILTTLMCALICLVCVATFDFVDTVGVSAVEKTSTTISNKVYTPAHTTGVVTGKTIGAIHRSAQYHIYFEIDGEQTSLSVSCDDFKRLAIGDHIEVSYGFGRLTLKYVPTGYRLNER